MKHRVQLWPVVSALAASVIAILAARPASAAPNVDAQGVLADTRGMTLYVSRHDAPGVSRCTGACARAWLPFEASNSARPEGEFGIIRRDDGHAQWSYKGQPLYRFTGDSQPGDSRGHHAGDAWSTARTRPAPQQGSGSASDYAF